MKLTRSDDGEAALARLEAQSLAIDPQEQTTDPVREERLGCRALWRALVLPLVLAPIVLVVSVLSCWAISERYFMRMVARNAGPTAINCGYVPLRVLRRSALACAQSALDASQPFYAVFQRLGVDSKVLNGLAVNRDGLVAVLHYDAGFGAPMPAITVRECTDLELATPGEDWRKEVHIRPFVATCPIEPE